MQTESEDNKQRHWQQHIESWRKSELSQAAYCREHQLKPHRFSYWKRKLSVSPKSITPALNRFIQIVPESILPSTKEAAPLCVHLSNNYVIEGIQGDNLHLIAPIIEQLS